MLRDAEERELQPHGRGHKPDNHHNHHFHHHHHHHHRFHDHFHHHHCHDHCQHHHHHSQQQEQWGQGRKQTELVAAHLVEPALFINCGGACHVLPQNSVGPICVIHGVSHLYSRFTTDPQICLPSFHASKHSYVRHHVQSFSR